MKLDDIRARDGTENSYESPGEVLADRRYLLSLVDRYEKALREIATLTDYEDEPDGSDISAIVHAALESPNGSAGSGETESMDDVDSEGKGPNMPPGTRVVFMPDRDDTKLGMIERQILHYDGSETFWGNVRVRMDDGRYIEANCWQCKKIDSQSDAPADPNGSAGKRLAVATGNPKCGE